MKKNTSKQAVTSDERLKLAAKLDQELNEFIDNLPKREQQEAVPFDRWEEEITNHPFFMKDVPQDGEKMHPLYEGLQKLKYDPEENEPEELAIAYKDDGNFNFKHKNYRMAIISYTEGLKTKCGNTEIDATLYNNRSAAHYFLKNFRSALMDAENALKLNSGYEKVLSRAANCCFKMSKYDKAVDYCDKMLDINENNKEALELRKNSIRDAKTLERNKRKREIEEKKLNKQEELLIAEILNRGIKIKGGTDHLTLSRLEPQFPELFNSRVSVSENGGLLWPVVLFYPEYKIMDYIQKFDEQSTFLEQLTDVFTEYPEWDQNKQYNPKSINVYFENEKRENVKVDVCKTLLEILKLDSHIIKDGTPRFIILVAKSDVEKSFLEHR